MNRRKFIKAISMLAGALFVAPKVLFAKIDPYPCWWTQTSSLPDPNPDGGLTMAKLLKAKKIMDAEQVPGHSRMMYIGDGYETVSPFRFNETLT